MQVDLKVVLIAIAFFALGFLVAHGMRPVEAQQPAPLPASAFAGSAGAMVAGGGDVVILVRDNNVYRLQVTGQSGEMRPTWFLR